MAAKNKNYTMALAGAVILLWVFVLYKFYKSFWGDGTVVAIESKFISKGKIKPDANEKFVLKANYPDPFSGKEYRKERSFGESKQTRVVKQPVPKKEEVKIDFSFISYLGLIKNQANQKEVALVSVQGKEYMVSEGDQINEISFIKNFKDSIKVSYMGTIAFLRKK